MKDFINIAVDAMGGENSPHKVIKGIEIHSKFSKNIFYNIFGDKNVIDPMINKTNIAKATVPCVIMLSIGFKPFVTIIPTSDKTVLPISALCRLKNQLYG